MFGVSYNSTGGEIVDVSSPFQKSPRRPEYCNPTSILRKHGFPVDRESISCTPVTASNAGCRLAEKLYAKQPLKTCDNNITKIVEICKRDDEVGTFKCDLEGCRSYEKPKVVVWRTDDRDGKVKRHKLFDSEKALQYSLDKISTRTMKQGYGFLILQCVESNITNLSDFKTNHSRSDDNQRDFFGELVIITRTNYGPHPEYKRKRKNNKININIVLLDSLSRSHFYRSLPKTIKMFEQINSDRKTSAEILDFELFQAVHGHTEQNLHALFTGNVFFENATKKERESIGYGDLFKKFVANGYSTYYQDDMCYDQIWGLRLDLGTPRNWGRFKEALKHNHIHSTGEFTLEGRNFHRILIARI